MSDENPPDMPGDIAPSWDIENNYIALFNLLVSFLFRTTGHLQDAEDAAQQAIEKALRKRAEIVSLAQWTLHVARQEMATIQRRKANRREIFTAREELEKLLGHSLSNVAELQEELEIVEALQKIPKQQREAFVLFLEGFGYEDIKLILGANSVATLRRHVQNARRSLERILKEQNILPAPRKPMVEVIVRVDEIE